MLDKLISKIQANMLIIALDEYGTKGHSGPQNNDEVLKYFQDIGFSWVTEDEVAWCSAFISWVAVKAGYEKNKSLRARSWLNVGMEIANPAIGDICVLWRIDPKSVFGHVGLFIKKDENYVYLLGGNQANSVNISKFPITQVLGYRHLF